ncbi:helix-turn-helix domain-containing protein [Tersicoccus sp. MR15.9]|uniref:GlxA family transcriptional regulator n=1 Tax=Tersicoccus mangrovi TaxID=3121635 RepID=UPI002FE66620
MPHRLGRLVEADTVIVPGRADPSLPLDPGAVRALYDAAQRGARIASICVGALDLAVTGLLDGLRATTRWRAVAAAAARGAVVPLTRDADQAQYIRDDELGSAGLAATLAWIGDHAAGPVTVTDIARAAAVSTRTLNRRFADELGTTPSGWLTRARVRRAHRLLETTDWSVDRVADASGFGSAANLRARFGSLVGTSPTRYRTALGAPR